MLQGQKWARVKRICVPGGHTPASRVLAAIAGDTDGVYESSIEGGGVNGLIR